MFASKPLPSLGLLAAIALTACAAPVATGPGALRPSARPSGPASASASASPAALAPSPSAAAPGLAAGAGRWALPLRLTPVLPASLVGNDGAGLIANDGGALLANDGGGLIANDGAALLANDGGGLIANDGGGLIANDGAGVVASGGGNVVASGGGNVVAGGAGNRRLMGALGLAQVGAGAGAAGMAASRLRRRLWEVTTLTYVLDQAMFLWAKGKPVPGRWSRIDFRPRTLPSPDAAELPPALAKFLNEAFVNFPTLHCALRLKPHQARGWELEVQRLPEAGAELRSGQLLARFLVDDAGAVRFRVRSQGLRPVLEEAGDASAFIEGRQFFEGPRRVVEVDRPERIAKAASSERGAQLRSVLGIEESAARTRLRIEVAPGLPTSLQCTQVRRYPDPSRSIRFRQVQHAAQVSEAGLAFWERRLESKEASGGSWRFGTQVDEGALDDGGTPPGYFLNAQGQVLSPAAGLPAALKALLPGRALAEATAFHPAMPGEGEDPGAMPADFLPEAVLGDEGASGG